MSGDVFLSDESRSHGHVVEASVEETKSWLGRGIVVATIGSVIGFMVWQAGLSLVSHSTKRPSPKWVGKYWYNGKARLYKSAEPGTPVVITGLPQGPLEIVLRSESGDHLLGDAFCGDHGGYAGEAALDLEHGNSLHLVIKDDIPAEVVDLWFFGRPGVPTTATAP